MTVPVFPRPSETVEQATIRGWPKLKTVECAPREYGYAEALVEITRGTAPPARGIGDPGVGEVEEPRRS